MKAARAQDRDTIDKQNQQLSDYEAEINLLRRRIEALEQERERDKKEIARLTDALNRARIVSYPSCLHSASHQISPSREYSMCPISFQSWFLHIFLCSVLVNLVTTIIGSDRYELLIIFSISLKPILNNSRGTGYLESS